jgi:cytochrome c
MPRARRDHAILASLLAALVGLGLAGGAAYAAWREDSQARLRAARLTGGDPERGRALMRRYGCAGCHDIPGVAGASGRVGPPLRQMAGRVFIAGVVENTPDNLRRWIEDPRALDPRTAMPRTGATGQDVRDIAAYLYTLR